jgi:ribosomal-protein-alanine N-acetyltransferase
VPIQEARKGLEERPLQDYRKHGYGRWAAVYKPTGEVNGFAGLKYLDDLNEVDLGYRFFKEHWGKGLATEASRAVVAYGFDVLRRRRIIAFASRDSRRIGTTRSPGTASKKRDHE